MPDFSNAIDEILESLIELRHELHAHPELAFEETWTSARVLTELHALPNLKIRSGLAGTGIVALLNGDRDGPCVALRADMDALPIQEDNPELPYASKQPGKMHACGHDGHTTCLVGAARVLSRFADTLPGKVKFIFQPAEEHGGGGAKLVEEEGVLESPRVDAAFAIHGWPTVKVGEVVVGTGPVLAAATPFEVTIRGTGTHAAYPHRGNDVILAAAHVVTAVQAISSRWDPADPVLVSIANVEAGHTYNVLPQECRMKGTVRALRQQSHDGVISRLGEIVETTARAMGCSGELQPLFGYPALVNDPTCAKLVADAAEQVLGVEAVTVDAPPGMGGEDFAFFARRVPSAWFRVGVGDPEKPDCPALHTPNFDFADAAIRVGVGMHCEIVSRFMENPPLWRCG